MNFQQPIFWHQGLFLQPQHFQQADGYHLWQAHRRNQFLSPHPWGVWRYAVAQAALGTGTFEVTRLEAVFPDGALVSVPGNAVVEGRIFQEDWIEAEKPLTVYLGIKKWSEGEENVTVLPALENIAAVPTRFVTTSDPEDVADLYQSGPTAAMRKLKFALKVFWETERDGLGDYVLCPIAQLVRMGDDIVLSDRFSPPLLDIGACEHLLALAKDIRDLIASRGAMLEEMKTQRGIHTAEFGTRDMVYLLALRSLNRYVPSLTHLLEAPAIHPWVLYGVVRQIIGELSTFSERYNAKGESSLGEANLAPYDHTQLWTCFATARDIIAALIDEITAGPEYVIQLLYDGTYFASELPPAIFQARNRYYLVLKTEEDPKRVLESVETVAKLSSREHLPILIARALPGLPLEHLPVPPQELPRRASCFYFQIDHHNEQWAFVEKGSNLALYWDAAPDDLEVELMVVTRS